MKPVYILSACAISPQESFFPEKFLDPPQSTENGKLFVSEPDYRKFINPVAIRRMSRQVKMGISTGICALQMAGIETPDAIITGTCMGSLTDMEHFLKDMIRLEEQALNPTSFIQSTYNSVNGWIALQSKCTGYNQTFVHNGFSMELSLMDAQLFLNENTDKKQVLAGSFDELTEDYFKIKSKRDYWKKELPNSLHLLKTNHTEGTIAGEGAAFFTLSNESENAICSLHGVRMIPDPDERNMADELKEFLSEHHLQMEDMDGIMIGINGDSRRNALYEPVLDNCSEKTTVTAFKHLCGDYATAAGFGLWLAVRFFSEKEIPSLAILKKGTQKPLKNLLIVNHYLRDFASFILIGGDPE